MTRENRVEWFRAIQEAQPQAVSNAFDLILELEVDQAAREDINAATIRYVHACFGKRGPVPTEAETVALLEDHIDELANRTDSGVLMPKLEFEDEFNDLHRAVASYLSRLGIDPLINTLICPLLVRTVKGTTDPVLAQRPTETTKMHVDPWNGDPGDLVIVTMPILGDIEHTTAEYFRPPDDFETRLLRPLESYDEGAAQLEEGDKYPVPLRHGFTYLVDAIVPHRTVQQGGGIRLNLEIRLRRKTTEAESAMVEENDRSLGRLAQYIELNEWYSLGTTKRMHFTDTYADAQQGIFIKRPFNQLIYSVADA